ncbi:hypothetical protein [Haloarchaeobius amylolyticus]|uniref:hypothetical protein n=1 Tax=Haloarchaeobius amylolyticus TaxID=1198296 RepID=UPI002270DD1C|nr:hypothetical protein [Haloarchaeobius amylolyticus]
MAEQMSQQLTLDRIENRAGVFRAEIRFDIPSNLRGLTIGCPPQTTVTEADGFRTDGRQQLRWNGNQTSPTATMRVEVADGRAGFVSAHVDTGAWAIVEAPSVLSRWRFVGEQPDYQRSVTVSGDGVSSSDGALVYLGPHEEHRHTDGEQLLRLVVPESAELQENPRDILDAMATVGSALRVGEADREVVAIAAPTRPVNWGPGGLQAGANGFWVRDTARLDSPNTTWLHEYVHTRQNFETTSQTRWLVEATAVYLATYHSFVRGDIGERPYYALVNGDRCADAVLGQPHSWSTPYVPYSKGAKVAAWLDTKIRAHSTRSLEDVLWAANLADSTLDLESLERLTASAIGGQTADPEVDSVLSRLHDFVMTRETPAEFLPAELEQTPSDPTRIGAHEGVTLSDALAEAFGDVLGTEIVDGSGKVDEGMVFRSDSADSVISASDIFDAVDSIDAGGISVIGPDDRIVSDVGDGENVVSSPARDGDTTSDEGPDMIFTGEQSPGSGGDHADDTLCTRCRQPLPAAETRVCPNCGWVQERDQ